MIRKVSKSKKRNSILTRKDADMFLRILIGTTEPKDVLKKIYIRNGKKYKEMPNLKELYKVIMEEPMRKFHLDFIAIKFGLTRKQVAALSGISVRTLQRWRSNTALSYLVADSIFKLAELYDNGMTVFENDYDEFMRWLRSSIPHLNQEKPINLLNTRTGTQLIIEELYEYKRTKKVIQEE